MNTQKILRYLYSIGYTLDDFLFCTYNPDFVTRDGKRWEVKRISKYGKALFTWNQIYTYSGDVNITGVYENDILFIKNYLEVKPYIKDCVLDTKEMFCLLIDYRLKYLKKKRYKEARIIMEKLSRITPEELEKL